MMVDVESDLVTVAAPIFDTMGRPIASIGVVGPASRLSEDRVHQLALHIIEATRHTTSNAGNIVQSIAPRLRPSQKPPQELEVLASTSTLLGKCPNWRAENGGELVLSDLFAPSVITIGLSNGAISERQHASPAAVVGFDADGRVILAGADGLTSRDRFDQEQFLSSMPDTIRRRRFNHASLDRTGRPVFAMIEARARTDGGGFYQLREDASLATLCAPLTMWTGFDWTADGKALYCTDAINQRILRFNYDAESGSISDQTVVMEMPAAHGRPDALVIDESGALWVSLWDGWRIVRITPAGQIDSEIVLPVPRPVGLCFGGSDMRTLFITSAKVRLSPQVIDEAPLSGAVFQFRSKTPGLRKPTLRAGYGTSVL